MPSQSLKLALLRKRADFLAAAATGKKWVAPGFILQIGPSHPPQPHIRYGLTATRKIGTAVVRNRARRRLRAVATQILPYASPDHDYVLIARAATPAHGFADLKQDLTKGLKRLGLWRGVV